jgi:hypothetical protein
LQQGADRKLQPVPGKSKTCPGNGEAAEEALERNLLAIEDIGSFAMQTAFSTLRTLAHYLKKIAILKLAKPALCPLTAVTIPSPRKEEWM